nr:molybdenum cofactor guanylyltransferase [Cyanobium sp. NIES-981]
MPARRGPVLWRSCLLSGGHSRRMGQDKALLPHPAGGTWLSRTVELLADLQAPLTVCSHHRRHRQLLHGLSQRVEITEEPVPGQGPLNALHHLMGLHPGEDLLICAVDMPWLDPASLHILLAARQQAPDAVLVATDGDRLHPLLGIYPATPSRHSSLERFLALGGRSMLGWLGGQPFTGVTLDPRALANCNRPEEWVGRRPAGAPVNARGQATGWARG